MFTLLLPHTMTLLLLTLLLLLALLLLLTLLLLLLALLRLFRFLLRLGTGAPGTRLLRHCRHIYMHVVHGSRRIHFRAEFPVQHAVWSVHLGETALHAGPVVRKRLTALVPALLVTSRSGAQPSRSFRAVPRELRLPRVIHRLGCERRLHAARIASTARQVRMHPRAGESRDTAGDAASIARGGGAVCARLLGREAP